LLGWADEDNTVLFDKSTLEPEDQIWRPVFDQCMKAIYTAKLVPATNTKDSNQSSDVFALSVDNINDVFAALEFLASIKSLPFVTGEVSPVINSSFVEIV